MSLSATYVVYLHQLIELWETRKHRSVYVVTKCGEYIIQYLSSLMLMGSIRQGVNVIKYNEPVWFEGDDIALGVEDNEIDFWDKVDISYDLYMGK